VNQPIERLVLHVGMHRAGSTLLQRTLVANRKWLRSDGIAFVDHHAIRSLPNHKAWMNRRGAIPSGAGEFDRQLASLAGREMDAVERATGAPPRVVFLSSEAMVGARVVNWTDRTLFRPYMESAIGQVIRALEPGATEVILVTRRQDTLMESGYLWEVQKGSTTTFDEQFPYDDRPVIDYSSLLARLGRQPSVTRVTAVPFELIGAGSGPYVGHIASMAGASALPDALLESRVVANSSYSAPALGVAKRVNHLFEGAAELRSLREFLWAAYPSGRYPRAVVLDAGERQVILDRYAAANRRLFAGWLPWLDSDSYAGDEAGAALGDALLMDRSPGR